MVSTPKRILIVAGEASGDLHAANLIRAMKEGGIPLSFYGIGGTRMAQEGCDILIPMAQVSAMGFVEVVRQFRPIWSAFQRVKRELFSPQPPDLLITIDFQEFNQKLAAQAQRAGVKVLHYVSPQVWAWRPGRARRMARLFDKMAVIFPFEPDCYQGLDLDVRYVGHPLLDDLCPPVDANSYREGVGCSPEGTVIGLFPGSRRSEVEHNLPTMVETAKRIQKQAPSVEFLIPVASTLDRETLLPHLSTLPGYRLVGDEVYTVANACDAVLVVSGTVTLQVALVGTPMAIQYRMPPLTYSLAKRMVKTPFIGLPNIVAGREVIPEFIQEAATPDRLAAEILRQIQHPDYRQAMIQGLNEIKDRLGSGGSSRRVAEMAFDLLKEGGDLP